MMKLAVGVLCDRAIVREGLLNMLGGGVTSTSMSLLPAQPDMDLALIITSEDSREFVGVHKVDVTLVRRDSPTQLGKVELSWVAPNVEIPSAGPNPTLPVSVPLRGLTLMEYGMHDVVVEIDGIEVTRLPLLVQPLQGDEGTTTRAVMHRLPPPGE